MDVLVLELMGIILIVLGGHLFLDYLGGKLKELYKQRQLKKPLTISKFVRVSGGGYIQLFKYQDKIKRYENA